MEVVLKKRIEMNKEESTENGSNGVGKRTGQHRLLCNTSYSVSLRATNFFNYLSLYRLCLHYCLLSLPFHSACCLSLWPLPSPHIAPSRLHYSQAHLESLSTILNAIYLPYGEIQPSYCRFLGDSVTIFTRAAEKAYQALGLNLGYIKDTRIVPFV